MSTKDKYNKSLKTMKLLATILMIAVATVIICFLFSIFYKAITALIDNSSLVCDKGLGCIVDVGSWMYIVISIVLALIAIIANSLYFIGAVLSIAMAVICLLYLIVIIHYKEKIKLENKKQE